MSEAKAPAPQSKMPWGGLEQGWICSRQHLEVAVAVSVRIGPMVPDLGHLKWTHKSPLARLPVLAPLDGFLQVVRHGLGYQNVSPETLGTLLGVFPHLRIGWLILHLTSSSVCQAVCWLQSCLPEFLSNSSLGDGAEKPALEGKEPWVILMKIT